MRTKTLAVLLAAFALVALAALVAGWDASPDARPAETTSSSAPPREGERGAWDLLEELVDEPSLPPPGPVRFLAWGDAGTGDETQRAVGRAAADVCAKRGCDFVLQLGDNVYPNGVHGPDDPQFVEKFEKPYAGLDAPFYGTLGNHDVALPDAPGAERDNGDFMVRYSQREDRPSDKWTMPARHYAFREENVQVIVLDLTALAHEGADVSAEAAQAEWLAEAWDESAEWHVVASHFPYVSNGAHGPAGRYDDVEGRGAALARFLEANVCGKADLYLAGHDHHLEWLKPVPSCGRTELVVSGAAAKPRPLKERGVPAWWSAGEVAGFFGFEVEGDRLTGRAYDAQGDVLFERTLRAD